MRIAVVTWSRRKVGGIETYLDLTLPLLAERGHEIALWHEKDVPANRDLIWLPGNAKEWCVGDLGAGGALRNLREWKPDLIYSHGLIESELEAAIPEIAPAVFFLHQYHGTCISGGKTWKWPRVTPCDRQFGWPCILHYYPHRCGGWHPLTMLEMFASQSRRLDALRGYRALATHTEHMRKEYIQHGFESERVFKIPFPVRNFSEGDASYPASIVSDSEPSKLLFLGRMDYLKGGTVLMEAVRAASAQLGRPLSLTFGGDGPERQTWEAAAAEVGTTNPDVDISFTGWVESSELSRVYSDADLLVLPSLWPEPFGMVGIEAGYFGLPSVAFDVGGISEWLHDGRNGRLARGDPPSATGLAEAIVDCLRDRSEYQRLSEGAHEVAQHFTPSRHIDALTDLFNQTAAK